MLARHVVRVFAVCLVVAVAEAASADDIAGLLLVPAQAGEGTSDAPADPAATAASDPTTADVAATDATTPAEPAAEKTAAAATAAAEDADTPAAPPVTDAPQDTAADAKTPAATPQTTTASTATATSEPAPAATATASSGTTNPTTSGTAAAAASAQPAPLPAAIAAKKMPAKKPVLVPGTGVAVKGGGDDFEDPKWQWYYNHPKSSEEMDKRVRSPTGRTRDGSWFEGPKRGTPDVVKRIPLPAPGLEGSTHGLLFSTRESGIPNRVTYQMQQDDLVFNLMRVTGRGLAVADSPSVVVRVYLPPYEQWENRTGPTFGFRCGCYTHAIITGDDHPDEGKWGLEEYWPGMFICFESSHEKRFKEDGAYLRIRGGRNGGEIMGPRIKELGWWTLGLSFSPDGMVHYFASPGVDDLTMDDHITSQFPYGYRTEWMKTFFFNVCSRDDGRTWSTPWVIDDPKAYFVKRPQMATTPAQKR